MRQKQPKFRPMPRPPEPPQCVWIDDKDGRGSHWHCRVFEIYVTRHVYLQSDERMGGTRGTIGGNLGHQLVNKDMEEAKKEYIRYILAALDYPMAKLRATLEGS